MANLPTVQPRTAALLETDWRVRHLREWDQVSQPFPMISPEETRQTLLDLDAALTPIDPKALAAALEQTLVLWRQPQGGESVAAFYLEALEEFPPEIVAAALKTVRMAHHYPSAPLPADFRKAAIQAATPLRGAQIRARLAMKRFDDEAARVDRWATREPVTVGAGTYPEGTRPEFVRETRDGTPDIDLGNIAARIAGWEQKIA